MKASLSFCRTYLYGAVALDIYGAGYLNKVAYI